MRAKQGFSGPSPTKVPPPQALQRIDDTSVVRFHPSPSRPDRRTRPPHFGSCSDLRGRIVRKRRVHLIGHGSPSLSIELDTARRGAERNVRNLDGSCARRGSHYGMHLALLLSRNQIPAHPTSPGRDPGIGGVQRGDQKRASTHETGAAGAISRGRKLSRRTSQRLFHSPVRLQLGSRLRSHWRTRSSRRVGRDRSNLPSISLRGRRDPQSQRRMP